MLLGPYRVLIVEDNPGDAELERDNLIDTSTKALSFDVTIAQTLRDALGLLADQTFDVIILDLNLPDSRGIETLTRVKSAAQTAPIMVVSGVVDDRLIDAVTRAGVEEVFTKDEAYSRMFSRSVLYLIESARARVQHRHLEVLLENMPDAVLVVNMEGHVRYINDAALRLFGRTRDDFLDERIGFSVRDDEPTEITVPKAGGDLTCEMRVVRFQWRGEPAFLCAIRDMTALINSRQEAERLAKAASDEAAVVRSILDSISDAVVVADTDGNYIHWNPAATAFLPGGAPSGDPLEWSKTYSLFEADQTTPLAPDRLPLVRAMQGESIVAQEFFARGAAGAEGTWISVNACPWRDKDGEVRGGVTAFRDVTQEKRSQTQLLVSDRMASVGMLAAGVAHEINNPLSAVLANLHLAKTTFAKQAAAVENADDLLDMLEDASAGAERVRLIVRDLKIFSRHEESKSSAVEVRTVLESGLRMAWNEIRHRAEVVKDYGNIGPVEAVESRLGQVVLNLMLNAAQAIPEGNAKANTIRIATRNHPSGRVAVEISDSGTGISPETLPHLFTPFFTTKAPGVGTGLGLAICHRIVTDMGGEIQVESRVGEGTTFRVLLPAAMHPDDRLDATSEPEATEARRRARVLVVDDEPAIGTVVRRILAEEHDVVAVTSATDGLTRIRQGDSFDVILCDLMMPQMTGIEFHEELLNVDPALTERIIFLTGGAFTPGARRFLDEVSNLRFEKPFDPQHLRTLINTRIG